VIFFPGGTSASAFFGGEERGGLGARSPILALLNAPPGLIARVRLNRWAAASFLADHRLISFARAPRLLLSPPPPRPSGTDEHRAIARRDVHTPRGVMKAAQNGQLRIFAPLDGLLVQPVASSRDFVRCEEADLSGG